MQYFLAILVVLVLIGLLIQYWYVAVGLAILCAIPPIVRHIRMRRYFSSEEFRRHRTELAAVVREHNDIANYAAEIRTSGSFTLGASRSGTHSNLATFQNTSRHAYRRDRNVAEYANTNVHNCSLQVVRNAAGDPLKYLIKYFDVKPSQQSIEGIEEIGTSVSRLEDAINNLKKRESRISTLINPPAFIRKHYSDELMKQVGVELRPITVPYPEFSFQYVSAGGNSSQKTLVKLDTPTVDALLGVLAEKIRFAKSAAGQRALMTARLRSFIKERDGYTCRQCAASVATEPNLLLEVDHIVPVSKGGLSQVENLQTLCWRCNRTKSNKLPAA